MVLLTMQRLLYNLFLNNFNFREILAHLFSYQLCILFHRLWVGVVHCFHGRDAKYMGSGYILHYISSTTLDTIPLIEIIINLC